MTSSVGVVVLRRTEQGVRLLVVRARTSWDFPRGRLNPGEEEFATAQRTVAGATGFTDLDFPFADAHIEALPDASGRVARYYLAETDDPALPPTRSTDAEYPRDEWRWVSFDGAEDVLPPRLARVLDWTQATIAA
jgi:8-oxo-dGTP pyrophosphatase MutT (NUDIX family)